MLKVTSQGDTANYYIWLVDLPQAFTYTRGKEFITMLLSVARRHMKITTSFAFLHQYTGGSVGKEAPFSDGSTGTSWQGSEVKTTSPH